MGMSIGIIVIFIYIVVCIERRRSAPKRKGKHGEERVAHILSSLDPEYYMVLNNILFKTPNGTTQIDHVVVSQYGIFVIEVKNYSGWIYGSERDHQWTETFKTTKHHFMNPIHQNYGHIKNLEALIGKEGIPFYSIITFSNNATLKLNLQHEHVVYFFNLLSTIQALSTQPVLTHDQMLHLTLEIKSYNIDQEETRNEHITNIQNRKAAINGLQPGDICPKCGGRLVVRTGKHGKFIGCDHYPKCHFTKDL